MKSLYSTATDKVEIPTAASQLDHALRGSFIEGLALSIIISVLKFAAALQVHRAVSHDGEELAVKVGLIKAFSLILLRGCSSAQAWQNIAALLGFCSRAWTE